MANKRSVDTCIQDPAWADSSYLLEEIITASKGASYGVAAFAFASHAGARLLLQDSDFLRFLGKSRFDLVVGVDAITDTAALRAISTCGATNRRLAAKVFLNPTPGTMFHPKLCWFRHKSHGKILVGSGNLTTGGLRGNCEAFSIAEVTPARLAAFERKWLAWCEHHNSDLLPLNDPRVVRRASENEIVNARTPRRTTDVLIEEPNGDVFVGRSRDGRDAVLVAEIPRAGSRWNQANFNLDTYRGFFGAAPGKIQRIILTHVDAQGNAGPQEVRPGVSVRSNNHRFELEAAAGLSYPSNGRPIAVFVRVATRTFRYRLLMPAEYGYRQAAEYLAANVPQGSGVRRYVTSMSNIRNQIFLQRLAD